MKKARWSPLCYLASPRGILIFTTHPEKSDTRGQHSTCQDKLSEHQDGKEQETDQKSEQKEAQLRRKQQKK